MKKRMVTGMAVIALLFGFFAAILPGTVTAHEGGPGHDHGTVVASESELNTDTKERLQKLAEQRKEAEKKRLELLDQDKNTLRRKSEAEQKQAAARKEQFKAACENRRENFRNRLESIGTRAQKHVATLESITARVEEFKTRKNLTVENYDALVADVAAQKALVQSLATTVKEQADTFTCGEEPGQASASLAAFKDALQQQIEALKAYKTSVKNLIVAVRAAAVQAEGAGDAQN